MIDPLSFMPAAIAAIDLASELLNTHQPGVLTAKGDRDMATEVDFAIEQKVRALLRGRTPSVGFLGEEEGYANVASELVWTLDPIDGTANFVHGIPLCGVSLGLMYHGRPVLGIIDLPFLRSRYTATEGGGARFNGAPIRISTTSRLCDAMIAVGDYAVGDDADSRNRLRLAVTRELAAKAQRVRMFGSAAIDLAWLAHGRLDAVVILSNKPWDTAAGVIIAREAGAHVADVDGSAHRMDSSATIGAGPGLLAEVLNLIKEAESGLT